MKDKEIERIGNVGWAIVMGVLLIASVEKFIYRGTFPIKGKAQIDLEYDLVAMIGCGAGIFLTAVYLACKKVYDEIKHLL